MNNDFLFKYLLFLSNKDVTGNSLSVNEFNMSLQVANIKHFKKKIGIPEEYKVGMPISRQSFELSQVLTDDVLPFKVHLGSPNIPYLPVDTNGYAALPQSFFYPSSLEYRYFPNNDCEGEYIKRKIDVLTDGQWPDVEGSAIRKPTLMYPACNFQAGAIRFLPRNIQRVEFVYLRLPVTPVYDYYINTENEYVYLEPGVSHVLTIGEEGSLGQQSGITVQSLSVELEWNETNKLDILNLMLSHFGLNVREGMIEQFAEMTKQSGQ